MTVPMILDHYEDHRGDPPGKFKYIGYWTSPWHVERGVTLPDPKEFVAEMSPALQSLLVTYLDADKNRLATVKERWRGWSNCRICGMRGNGTQCMTDGTFVWPEGFKHYVAEHSVRPPDEFIDHVRRTIAATMAQPIRCGGKDYP